MFIAPSPLSDSAVLSLAVIAMNGGPIGGNISREDAIRIFGAAFRIRQKRLSIKRAQAAIAEGMQIERLPGMAGRLPTMGATGIPTPDEIVSEILSDPIFQALLRMLAALTYASLPIPRPRHAPGFGNSFDTRPGIVALDLLEYLRHTRQGEPLTQGGRVVGRSWPATYPAAKDRRIWLPLRAWANTLPDSQVSGWIDRDRIASQLDNLVELGELIRKSWSAPLATLGRPIEATYLAASDLASLPIYPYPVTEDDLALPPQQELASEGLKDRRGKTAFDPQGCLQVGPNPLSTY